jgi:ribose transport system substrate-binding protein
LEPGYHFVFDGHVDPPKLDAAKLIGEALGRLHQFDAVFVGADAGAPAAYDALKPAGRNKGVLFLGVGGVPNEGADVRTGDLTATILVPTGGAEAVDAAVKLLHGEKVPKTIVPEIRVLTK